MSQLDICSVLLLGFITLGIISGNSIITIAMVTLLLIRVTNLHDLFPWIENYGLTVGIIILTIGVMAPIASGKLSIHTVLQSFIDWKSLLAIIVGIFVAYLSGRGAHLITQSPIVVAGLLIGTVLGVAFFRGVPVGPLIAAGILSLFIGKS